MVRAVVDAPGMVAVGGGIVMAAVVGVVAAGVVSVAAVVVVVPLASLGIIKSSIASSQHQ